MKSSALLSILTSCLLRTLITSKGCLAFTVTQRRHRFGGILYKTPRINNYDNHLNSKERQYEIITFSKLLSHSSSTELSFSNQQLQFTSDNRYKTISNDSNNKTTPFFDNLENTPTKNMLTTKKSQFLSASPTSNNNSNEFPSSNENTTPTIPEGAGLMTPFQSWIIPASKPIPYNPPKDMSTKLLPAFVSSSAKKLNASTNNINDVNKSIVSMTQEPEDSDKTIESTSLSADPKLISSKSIQVPKSEEGIQFENNEIQIKEENNSSPVLVPDEAMTFMDEPLQNEQTQQRKQQLQNKLEISIPNLETNTTSATNESALVPMSTTTTTDKESGADAKALLLLLIGIGMTFM